MVILLKTSEIFILQANLSKQSKPDLRVFPVFWRALQMIEPYRVIRDKKQPTTAWRKIWCHIKVCCVFNEVLFWIDDLGVVCLGSELGASELSSKGKEGSVYRVSFCCPTGNPTMPTWRQHSPLCLGGYWAFIVLKDWIQSSVLLR